MENLNNRPMENEKIIPYLVQRACQKLKMDKFDNVLKGIDGVLKFDRMRYSDFDWDILNRAINRMSVSLSEYTYLDVDTLNKKSVTVFCKNDIKSHIEQYLVDLYKKENTKEYTGFYEAINNFDNIIDEKQNIHYKEKFDFWWDIENDIMFWVKSPDFEAEFRDRIKITPFETDLKALGLSERPLKTFLQKGIDTLEKLIYFIPTMNDVIKMRNCGNLAQEEIFDLVRRNGCHFGSREIFVKYKETAEEFVKRMLTGLTAKTLPEFPNKVFYVDKGGSLIFIISDKLVEFKHYYFIDVLQTIYKIDKPEKIIIPIVKDLFKIEIDINSVGYFGHYNLSKYNSLENALRTNRVRIVGNKNILPKHKEPSIKTTTNERGFERAEFKDSVGNDCMIKQGGMQTNEGMGVWLGIPQPQITVFTDKGMANSVSIPTPENWQIGSLMYLSDKQIKQLIPMLQNFLKTGKLNKVSTTNKKTVKKLSAKTETKRVKKS